MKFPLPQEVSRHVRDKECNFYRTKKAVQSSATSTITSKDFFASTPDSIKIQSGSENEKVSDLSPSRIVVGQGLELIENNFVDLLPTTSYQGTSGVENEFGMIIDEMEGGEQGVQVSFACKLCEFR